MIQGIWLSVASVIVSALAGTIWLYFAVLLYRFAGNPIEFVFPMRTFLFASALCFATILLSYGILVRRLSQTDERNLNVVHSKHQKAAPLPAYTSISKLYHYSVGKAYRKANRTGGVLILLMIAVMSFGTYAVQLFVEEHFDNDFDTKGCTGRETHRASLCRWYPIYSGGFGIYGRRSCENSDCGTPRRWWNASPDRT